MVPHNNSVNTVHKICGFNELCGTSFSPMTLHVPAGKFFERNGQIINNIRFLQDSVITVDNSFKTTKVFGIDYSFFYYLCFYNIYFITYM